MAKVTSLALLVLAVAAVSIPAPAGAAGAGNAALKRAADFLEKWKKRIEDAKDRFEAIDKATDGELLPRGNDAAAGLLPNAVAVDVVKAGGVNFSVGGVDVTSRVTWTSRCGGDSSSQQVACGDPLCEKYGACDGGDAPSAAGRVCNSAAPAGVPLRKGNITLFGAKSKGIFSNNTAYNTAYACRPDASGDYYAVIGLGRGNNILASFPKEWPLFSYIIDGDLQGSTVWLAHNAFLARRATAARAGSRSITLFGPVGSNNSTYSVKVTGIKVGGGEVASEAATGILTTTMPFTFLNSSLFDHLKQELKAVASPVNGSVRFGQLCYPNGTKLPAITLLFVGENAGMELQPEHYSYKKSNGVVCLSILPSPWSNGLSVIGSMVQAGRQMTYKLDDNTLTFDDAASASSKPSPSTSSSVAQAPLTPFCLSPAFAVLLLAIIM
ncbi:hypothetical protein SEVIR_6G203700v4 [Setaria viridis]|uniref:Peptidase A1 domain-containing protein n=1 Tax=Setaria viridis TaxID=4556 RepID=A0A4U6U5Q3_SETVI|nr:uncharacterized protein LOC117861918 [Setaria viridis]TKW10980.1 hypothetical protein SEVIR_6G203700v2 [Setaria viridis]